MLAAASDGKLMYTVGGTSGDSDLVTVIAAVVVILVVVAVARASRRRRQRQAEEIRKQAKLETARVERRQALADETAAKARAAQAEAEAKAAEAARLQERAAAHQSEAATSRERLQEQWKRAEDIDPEAGKELRESRSTSGRGESYESPSDTVRQDQAGTHRAASS